MKTVVVGGGIIGASVAYHLATYGADVTVFTGGRRGGIGTAVSFAWINAAPGYARNYFELRLMAILDWHRLQHELGKNLEINWSGSLWWEDEIVAMKDAVTLQASWGYPIRIISAAEAAEQEPSLCQYPPKSSLSTLEGSLAPLQTGVTLLAAAVAKGATIRDDTVCSIITKNGHVRGVRTESGDTKADHVVLAAGIASEQLAADIGVILPMANLPDLLAYSEPLPPLLRGVILSPRIHMRQNTEGRIVVGQDFGGTSLSDNPQMAAESLMTTVRDLLINRNDLRLAYFTQGIRPIPSDGLPIMGPTSKLFGLYVTVMHSGVTLAALAGRLAAEEIMTGCSIDILAPFRPDRFT